MGCLGREDLDWIWIGDAEDARDAAHLRKANIKYVLNCTMRKKDGGVMNFHEKDSNFSYCRLRMADNATEHLSEHFEMAWEFLERIRVREDGSVLVHCQQGVSRSVSIVLSYMMKYYRMSFDESLALAKNARKQAGPNESFMQQLRRFEDLLIKTGGYEEVPPPRKRQADLPITNGRNKMRSIGPQPPISAAPGGIGPVRSLVGSALPPECPDKDMVYTKPTTGAIGPQCPSSASDPVDPTQPAPQNSVSIGPAVAPIGPQIGPGIGPTMPP